MNLETSRVEQNEQVKAVDFDFAFESIASNIALAIRRIVGQTESDILIGGVVTAAPGSSMNIIISEILASGLNSFALDTEQIGPIGVSASTTADRRDIVQVRGVYEGFDSKQRGFYDTDTDIVTYAFIDTKKKLAVEVSVKAGVPGSVSAPTTDEGYIKIAEILIPAGSINITDGNIFNVTADISGVENNYWKTEKSRSFRVGGINDIKTLFRVQHEASGAHKDNVIGANSIKIGNAQNFLNGSIIPNGASALIGSENLPATTTIPNMIASVLAYINTEIADRKKLSEITTQVSSDMTLGSFEKNTRRYLFNPSENNITISMKSGEKIKEEASFVLLSKELVGMEKISETDWVFVSRNLVDASTVLGKIPGTRGLDYLQSGTVAQMAAKVLSDLKTVDGSGSGSDADLLDGQHGSYYAPKDHASSETTYGVSSEANYGHAKASTVAGSANGVASKGTTPAVFAQSNHVHPLQTSVSGNADTATLATLATQALAIKPLGNSITLPAVATSVTKIVKIATVSWLYHGSINMVCHGNSIEDVIKVYIGGSHSSLPGISVICNKLNIDYGLKKIIVTRVITSLDSNKNIYAEIVTNPNNASTTTLGVVETNRGTFTPSMTEVSSVDGTVLDSLSLSYYRGDISSYQHEFTKNIIGNLTGNADTATLATQALAIKPLGNSITLPAVATSVTKIVKIATVDFKYSGSINITCTGRATIDRIKVYVDGGWATAPGIRAVYGKFNSMYGIKKIIVTSVTGSGDSNRNIYAEIVTYPDSGPATDLGVVETNVGIFTPSMTEVSSVEGTVVDSLALNYARGDISSYQHEFTKNIIGNLTGNADTATKLANARKINGVSFDGSTDITVADSTKAPLASPALTGTPTAPTPVAGTNNTQIATTAFVKSQKYTTPNDYGASFPTPNAGNHGKFYYYTGAAPDIHFTLHYCAQTGPSTYEWIKLN